MVSNSGEQKWIMTNSRQYSPFLVQHWSGFVENDHMEQWHLSAPACRFDQACSVKKKKTIKYKCEASGLRLVRQLKRHKQATLITSHNI